MPRQNNNKKNKSRNNPLAQARGPQKAPENLWYRRSGAGYRCFVEYYCQQPDGVITIKKGTSAPQIMTQPPKTKRTAQEDTKNQGMSRAAKRRRKKKGGTNPQNIEDGDPRKPESKQTESFTALSEEADHPLLQAALSNSNSRVRPEQLAFFQAMARPLPTTFRIRSTVQSSRREEILQQMKSLDPTAAPIPIAPNLFQLPVAKSKLPLEWKEFLLKNSQSGDFSRQELGSMLPVLILPLKVGDCVVDMCASPGSKTLQALEVVGRSEGLVLANDILESRIKALRDAVQRSGVLVHEADFDSIQYSQVDATKLKLSKPCDAIICDVPCSGDGTCRKDPHILPMWKPQAGNSLHSTQLAILKRSIELLKVGGVVCYSTCSLNPVEDEAVVAAALKTFEGSVELIEIKGLEKTWNHRPGVSKWKVACYVESDNNGEEKEEAEDQAPKLRWYNSYDAAADDMEGALPTMWPETCLDNPLSRCARLLPQDYDSGGFFVALLRKKKAC